MPLTLTFQRPEAVKVDAQDITGARFTVSLSRLPSRVFQHEFDHLEASSSIFVTFRWTTTNKLIYNFFSIIT